MCFYVIESERGRFLGQVERRGGSLVIRDGFRGHPVLLDLDDVEEITPWENHPDAEFV